MRISESRLRKIIRNAFLSELRGGLEGRTCFFQIPWIASCTWFGDARAATDHNQGRLI